MYHTTVTPADTATNTIANIVAFLHFIFDSNKFFIVKWKVIINTAETNCAAKAAPMTLGRESLSMAYCNDSVDSKPSGSHVNACALLPHVFINKINTTTSRELATPVGIIIRQNSGSMTILVFAVVYIVMDLQLMDGTLEHRMSNVEAGLEALDTKVGNLDKKLDQFGNVQMDMFDEQNRFADEVRGSLADQKEEFAVWRQSVKARMGGHLQYWGCVVLLVIWILLMLFHF